MNINPLKYCCNTCKNLSECEKNLRTIWKDNYDVLCNDYNCDFYRRKNSGAFRRKCRKFKKVLRENLPSIKCCTSCKHCKIKELYYYKALVSKDYYCDFYKHSVDRFDICPSFEF